MNTIIETERLILREISETDIDVMLELHSDPEVHKYLGGQTITNREKLLARINLLQQEYQEYGVGRWAMIDKKSNEFIGWSGLEYVTSEINGHINFYDLGYRLLKRYWGQGFATESSMASLRYGFGALNANVIYAMADIDNIASNKILQKIGLEFMETFVHDGIGHKWYRLEASSHYVI